MVCKSKRLAYHPIKRKTLAPKGEEWKPNPPREACKALYNKWREVVFLLKGLLTEMAEKEEDMHGYTAAQLLGDAHLAGAKIMSSEAGGIYVLRMGKAAIVRELAMGIYSGLLLFREDEVIDEAHIQYSKKRNRRFPAVIYRLGE